MKEQDPILADELSRRIAAELQGKRQPPVSEAIEQEAELAAKLINLAQDTHPDPDFVASLGSQLARRAAQKKKIQKTHAPPERPSFWQQLTQLFKEGTTMNRNKYLLGALAALVLIVAAAFILANRNGSNEPAAIVTDNSGQTNTTDDASNENADQTTDETAVTEIADLPALPALEGSGQATGLGGGGGANPRPQSGGGGISTESASLDVDGNFVYTDPFSGTVFTLNTTLPSGPVLTAVLQNKPDEVITAEQAQELATRFGFTGQLYREQYPVFEDEFGGTAYEPPVVFHIFDGPRSLIIDAWGVYYNDTSIVNDFDNPLPFEQAVPIAEAYVQEHNLIDFEYEVQQIWGTDVNFVRKIDGQAVNQPELTVGVSNDGRIFFVSYQVMRNAQLLGRYPIITAQEAWEILQSGVAENGILYNYNARPELAIEEPVIIEDPLADLYQFWVREFAPGDEIHLYDWPVVFLPVDSGADPRIQVRNYIVQADSGTLNALAERVGQQTHIWGQVGPDGTTIELAGWDPIEQINEPISGPGTISRTGDEVLFTNNDTGTIYMIPNAPADLADGTEVYLFAWAVRDLGLAYPAADWENMDKIINIEPAAEDLPIEEPIIDEPLPVDGDGRGFEPFVYETFTVNEVSLAYYTTYSWPTDDTGEFRYEGQPTLIVQPTWKFSGQTDTGDNIDFYVQAANAELVDR